ncbi:MAG: YigZ family protein [Clostridia bacterium]|nr:YigZ family protein [Clostridia bacterium]
MIDLTKFEKDYNSKYGEIASGYYEIKKSKFYAYIFSAEHSENEVKEIIERIRKDNKKARHIVYCYNFIDSASNNVSKFSNDGEPQGTGVNSIISTLEKENVKNYLVVIVRYFGGTLLGSGPLLRSYLSAFKDAFEKMKTKV